MRKTLIIVITIIVALLVYVNVNAEEIIIPESAIRFRVISNSNSIRDQSMKMVVKEYVDDYLSVKMLEVKSIDEAREVIELELGNLEKGINDLFLENNYNEDFVIHYGDNFFPKKLYRGITYDDGIYESLVITIGSGDGDNWWCVLFPPLCLLEIQESEMDDVDYQFFVKKMIKNIFE